MVELFVEGVVEFEFLKLCEIFFFFEEYVVG